MGIQTDKSANRTEIATKGAAFEDGAQSNCGEKHGGKDNTRDIWSGKQDTAKQSKKKK
ncbi:hypothetical protein DIM_12860 [Candidatus Denitrolinea symbiosum]|nr:hypothetical protein DIM_12860 [Candidatus Denitrolinea symbiosum]